MLLQTDELRDTAHRRLNESPFQELRCVRVEPRLPGDLVLSGTVRSFYRKQLAQEMLRELAVSAGMRIVNELQVSDGFSSS